jgi:prepilin-type N-terminal cleavage/methylation domain-containing protein
MAVALAFGGGCGGSKKTPSHAPATTTPSAMLKVESSVRKRDSQGFTLLELLIVIVVLGVLAAIVVFAVGSVRGDATTSACKADGRLVEDAGSAYAVKNGAAAPTADDLTPDFVKSWPESTHYTISYIPTTGTDFGVTGTKTDGSQCYPTVGAPPSAADCTVSALAVSPPSATSNNSGHLTSGDIGVSVSLSGPCAGLKATFVPGHNGSTAIDSRDISSGSAVIHPNDFKWSPGSHPIDIVGASNSESATLTVSGP